MYLRSDFVASRRRREVFIELKGEGSTGTGYSPPLNVSA